MRKRLHCQSHVHSNTYVRRGGGMQPMVGGRGGMAAVAGGHAGVSTSGMFGRPGAWNPLDDNLLVAIVTEFSQVCNN
jgi:hypothetical protein